MEGPTRQFILVTNENKYQNLIFSNILYILDNRSEPDRNQMNLISSRNSRDSQYILTHRYCLQQAKSQNFCTDLIFSRKKQRKHQVSQLSYFIANWFPLEREYLEKSLWNVCPRWVAWIYNGNKLWHRFMFWQNLFQPIYKIMKKSMLITVENVRQTRPIQPLVSLILSRHYHQFVKKKN